MNDPTSKSMPRHLRILGGCVLVAGGAALAASCGGSSKATTGAGAAGTGDAAATTGTATTTSATTGTATTSATTGSATTTSGTGGSSAATTSTSATTSSATSGAGGATSSSGGGGSSTGFPAGWLYTTGSKIYVSNGSSGTPWMGRGVNVDDIFLCGYDHTLWMTNPDQTLETLVSGLMSGWKPSFVRLSLGMDSYPTVTSWVSDAAQYKTPMTGVIDAIGQTPGVYALVTLRSDASMILQDTADGDAEATGIPSDATSTPDATQFPTGTDATYVALVDTFANDAFVLFGLTNEPGGDKLSNAQITAAMSHAVGVIRAEEDRLGVPHHLVSVQGNAWTSNISFYAASPLPYDNVVYEVHGYPPTTSSYTYANLPVIVGEYGSFASAMDQAAFYADVEAKQIPNLAWDFDSYSDCAPDLLNVNQSASNLMPSAWGSTVQAYLLAHP